MPGFGTVQVKMVGWLKAGRNYLIGEGFITIPELCEWPTAEFHRWSFGTALPMTAIWL